MRTGLSLRTPRVAYATMREYADKYVDLDEATRAWLGSLTKAQKEAFIYPYARAAVNKMRRGDVHRHEREVAKNGGIKDVGARQVLLDDGFFLISTGGFVLWGDATPQMHRERAEWLRGEALGLLVTVKLHEEAADVIEAAGVDCLREVPA